MSVLDHPLRLPSGEAARGVRRALSLTCTLGLVALAILLPVMQNSDEATQGYRIRALEQQKADLEAQNFAAQSEIAQLGSLTRIDTEARGRLGMVPAGRGVAVEVNIPLLAIRAIPIRYLPAPAPSAPPAREPRWQRLLHLLPFS